MYPLVQWDGNPLVQWDGMDRSVIVGQSVGIPRVPIGTVGWDRQVGYIAVWTVGRWVSLWEFHVYVLE